MCSDDSTAAGADETGKQQIDNARSAVVDNARKSGKKRGSFMLKIREENELNNEIIELSVGSEDAGERLDAFIGRNTDELSRSYAVKLIERGRITINGLPAKSKKQTVAEGDTVAVDLPEPEVLDVKPEDIPLDIVYEDDDVLVVNKPRGMVVHPGPGNWSGTLVNAVMHHCGESLSTINGVVRPGIVHRIDKDTSGLLMIAKNDRAHESLAEQLRVHSVTREYTALCLDNIAESRNFGVRGASRDEETGIITINVPIGRDVRNRMRNAVNGAASRNAVTHITVLERFGRYTLVRARLETGRTHQIRVHMAYIHHPLAGDDLYGPKRRTSDIAGIKVSGQLLHAGTLGFVHPATGEYMEFHSELPEIFTEVLDRLRNAKK